MRRPVMSRVWARLTAGRIDLLLAGLDIGLGAALLAGGPMRTSAASFNTARDLMPIHAWGGLFLIVGIASWALTSRPQWAAWPLVAGLTLFTFWAAAFALSAAHNPAVAVTGIVTYSWVCVVHALAVAGVLREVRRSHAAGA